MKRSEFLKKFGLGLAAIAIASKVIAEVTKPKVTEWITGKQYFDKNYFLATDPASGHMITVSTAGELDPSTFNRKYPLTYKECYSCDESISIDDFRKYVSELGTEYHKHWAEHCYQEWLKEQGKWLV